MAASGDNTTDWDKARTGTSDLDSMLARYGPADGKTRQNVGDSRTDTFNDGVESSRQANGGLDDAQNRGVHGSGGSVI